MTRSTIKQFMAYSFLAIGLLVVRMYIKVNSARGQVSTSAATDSRSSVTDIVALTAPKFHIYNPIKIPQFDNYEEIMSRMKVEIEARIKKYLQKQGFDSDNVKLSWESVYISPPGLIGDHVADEVFRVSYTGHRKQEGTDINSFK